MIGREGLISVFKMRYISNASLRGISSSLGMHRSTVAKYIKVIEDNLDRLKDSLALRGECPEDGFDKFIKDNWEDYIEEIVRFTHVRSKRALTNDVIEEIRKLAKKENTSSAIVLFRYIEDNLIDSELYGLSYSSIYRVLKDMEKDK